jgi:hypothetical protein
MTDAERRRNADILVTGQPQLSALSSFNHSSFLRHSSFVLRHFFLE